jgi:hypothetical protein
MRKNHLFILAVLTVFLALTTANGSLAQSTHNPTPVSVGVWLINVEKVDLASSTFKLDFYLWFRFDPSQISLEEVKNFEFVNGAPTKYEVTANTGYLEYRVKGDFIKTFDFTKYPFENQQLSIKIEHKALDNSQLVYVPDLEESNIDSEADVAGWSISSFNVETVDHSYGDASYSRFVSTVVLQRPLFSSIFKSVMPISVITTIALLAFFVSPKNFAQRIGLGVTTLLSATAFHLSLLNGIPPTGYLTFADKMMIFVYILFLYDLSVSVLIMRCVDAKREDAAEKMNRKALKVLPLMISVGIIILAVSQLL